MRCVELFCGAGGMSLGFEQAGFEIVGAVDCWEDALRVYESNLGHPTFRTDLKDVLPAAQLVRSLRPDIIIGGPPCQDFSSAGSQVERENAEMTVAFGMIAVIARPKWIVIENVPQMLKSQAWAQARAFLAEAGYGISISTIDASYYGVPQHRKRVVVICRLGEADAFMETAIKQAAADKPMALCDLLLEDTPNFVYSHPRFPGKRSTFSAAEPYPTVRSTSRRAIPKRYYDEDAALLAAGFFFTRPYHQGRGVRTLNEPTPAIIRTSRERPRPAYLTAPHPRDPVHPSQARTLTQAQTARVQGFPIWWDWSSAPTVRDADQMIANAVPAPLAQAIAALILEREHGGMPPIPSDFLDWLRKAMRFGEKVIQGIQSALRQAWRHLSGRILADHHRELHTLETTVEFAALDTRRRYQVRKALKLHQEWRSTNCGKTGLQAHQIPDRGGLRGFFRNVGKRMGFPNWRPVDDCETSCSPKQPTTGRVRAKSQKTRQECRAETRAIISPTAQTSLWENPETSEVDPRPLQNGMEHLIAIKARLDDAPLPCHDKSSGLEKSVRLSMRAADP